MANTILSSTTIANPSGNAQQVHVIYAVNSARWWAFWIAGNTIATAYSSDGITWTTASTFSITATATADGRALSVTYNNLASVDVVHLNYIHASGGTEFASHVRATISGTSISFGSGTDLSSDTYGNAPMGDVVVVDTAGIVWVDTGLGLTVGGDTGIFKSSNADAGGSWTNAWGSVSIIDATQPNGTWGRALIAMASGKVLSVTTDGNETSATSANTQDLNWSQYNGTSWPAVASVFGTGVSMSPNDWGIAKVSTTDVHVVRRTGTNTYAHRRFNGTSWSAGQSIPTQTSKANSGIALYSDGTNLWAFIIDSASGNAVRYCKWTASGPSWGSWTDLEATSATRDKVSVAPNSDGSNILVSWTEGTGSPWAIKDALLSVGGTSSFTRDIPATAALASIGLQRSIPATAALRSLGLQRDIPATARLQSVGLQRDIPATARLQSLGVQRDIPATAALQSLGLQRSIPATAWLQSLGLQRTIPASAALQSLGLQRAIPATARLQSLGLQRDIPATAWLAGGVATIRTIPATVALRSLGLQRSIPATAWLQSLGLQRVIPASAALQSVGLTRSIPATARLQALGVTRSIPATAALQALGLQRAIPATAWLQSLGLQRSIPASARLQSVGLARDIPASARLQALGLVRSIPATCWLAIPGQVQGPGSTRPGRRGPHNTASHGGATSGPSHGGATTSPGHAPAA
jgi:hypothetical protein